jgi:hypothetical protein
MKFLFVLVAACISGSTCAAQSGKIDFAKLQVSGLKFTASKSQVLTRLGKPLSIVEPHYECGEYSSEQEGQKFYQLRYQQATFIGNARQGYELESFRFGRTGPAQLTYGQQLLSAATTLPEFIRLFGKVETHKNKDGSVALIVWQQDASATFTFKAGHLSSYSYSGVGC